MPFAQQDQGLGSTVQGGPSVRVVSTACSTASSGARQAISVLPRLVTQNLFPEVALTEIAIATGDAVDGEVLTYLEIGRVVSRRGNGLAIQLVEHPVVVLQVLRGEAGEYCCRR